MTRLRRRAKPARPYICLLSILKVNLDGPGFQALTVAVAEHVGELADQVAGGGEFLAAEW